MTQLQRVYSGGHPPQQQPGSSPLQHQRQQQSIESQLRHRLESTGEIDRLHRQLSAQLVECGWHDALKDRARELIRQKGLTRVTLDELVSELVPAGRSMVPPEVKGKALEGVRSALVNNNGNGGLDGGNGGGGAVGGAPLP